MCGILGWFGEQSADDVQRFNVALDTLEHRGPDDRGVFTSPSVTLGHRRLSIIDLSSAGHQPMVEPSSGSVISFNGEIYNHVEIRKELESIGHRFIGSSDTEVLLHAMVEWEEDALPRLNGMWAFAFWMPAKRKLILSRDRFGIKPLYYRNGPGGLSFASEPKALLALFPELRELSEEAALDFLGNNTLYTNGRSFYKGIDVFPSSSYGVYTPDNNVLRVLRYWDYPAGVDDELSAEDAVEQFETLFSDAVRLRLRSDVPVGLTLSGGLDSTGVLAAANHSASSPLKCFTSVYGDGEEGELHWARLATEAGGSPLVAVQSPKEDWLETMNAIAWHMDGPGYSPAVYPQWQLMRRARATEVPVLLEGQGADEALAGYPQYAALDMLNYLRGSYGELRTVSGIFRRISSLSQTFSLRWIVLWFIRETWPTVLRRHRQRAGFQSLLREGVELPCVPEPLQGEDGDSVRQRLRADHSRDILPGLLHYGDAMSMAHSIESRNPFLDHRLVEWIFRAPRELRFKNDETKWVLREYLRRNDQAQIGNRKDKKGYPTPVGSWMAEDFHKEVEALLLDSNSVLNQWCEPEKIRGLLRQSRRRTIYVDHHLYKLLSTQLWANRCL